MEVKLYAFLSIIPILAAVALMAGLNVKSGKSMAAAWAVGIALAIFVWKLDYRHAAAYTVYGFLVSTDTILIIFGAIFLLNVLINLGYIKAIGAGFGNITNDRRIQILIIGWLFTSFVEGAAGFGTPGALAAPLLVGLGAPPFAACLSTLIGGSAPTAFGAVGTPPITGFNTIAPAIAETFPNVDPALYGSQFYSRLALTNVFTGTFIPIILIITIVAVDGSGRGRSPFAGFSKSIVPIIPLCIFSGAAFTVPVYVIATFVGPEIATMLGALAGLALLITAVKKGFLIPKDIWRFQNDPAEAGSVEGLRVPLWKAWSPYIIIAALLTATRLPWLPIREWINAPARNPAINGLFGFAGINWAFKPLNNPGLFPFIPVALIYAAAGGGRGPARKRFRGAEIAGIAAKTFGQIKNASVALLFGVALVQIMRYTDYGNPGGGLESMTTEVAKALAGAFGGMYPLVSPFVGAFGAFVAGSNTVSNIMFMPLQFKAAAMVGLPTVMIAIGQSLGGAIGNMACVHNVVAVTATTGAEGSEGRLIAAAAAPCAVYCLMLSATLFIYLAAGISWAA